MSRSENQDAGEFNSRRTLRADNGPAWLCLIVAADSEYQQLVSRAVSSAGWEPIACSDVDGAYAAVRVRLMQLAIVVLEGDRSGHFDALLEHLARTHCMLLVVCGNQNAMEEETYVRQLGAWVYLPGMADAAAVTNLCAEARRIAEHASQVAESSAPKGPVSQPRTMSSRARSRRVK
jgi:ActR/RegA family two-component response regulator